MIRPKFREDFEGFKEVARSLILERVHPEQVQWSQNSQDLFAKDYDPKKNIDSFNVSKRYVSLARAISYARNDTKWSLLYRILYRLKYENSKLLELASDPDVREANLIQKSVSRDIHKMHAFVRFKKALVEAQEVYVAWHKSEHLIVRAAAPFFQKRFGDRPWSIYTPDESAHWDLEALSFGPGMNHKDFNYTDEMDEAWIDYYSSIYNPARLNTKQMRQEMSPKYWESMPESLIIKELVDNTPKLIDEMSKLQWREATVDASLNLSQTKEQAKSCKACSLHCSGATQIVFGEGPINASVMIVGDMPEELDDRLGRPFSGTSGKMIKSIVSDLGIKREECYFTHVVKHFKFKEVEGKKIAINAKGQESHACRPWLEAEIEKVRPKVILGLGTSVGIALTGKRPNLPVDRGKLIELENQQKIILSWPPNTLREGSVKLNDLRKDILLAKNISRSC